VAPHFFPSLSAGTGVSACITTRPALEAWKTPLALALAGSRYKQQAARECRSRSPAVPRAPAAAVAGRKGAEQGGG